MKYSKLQSYQREDFINLITKLNAKVVYLQRQKSQDGIKGRTNGYKSKVCQSMIITFLQKDCKHELDEIPPITDYTLKDFRDRLATFDEDQF